MNDDPKDARFNERAPGERSPGDGFDDSVDDIAKLLTQRRIIYGLFAVGSLFFPAMIAGLIVAYIARGEIHAREKARHGEAWLESHYTFLIRTFWIGLLYSLIAFVLVIIMIGPLLMIGISVWFIIRVVRGWLWMEKGEAVPQPESWWVG